MYVYVGILHLCGAPRSIKQIRAGFIHIIKVSLPVTVKLCKSFLTVKPNNISV